MAQLDESASDSYLPFPVLTSEGTKRAQDGQIGIDVRGRLERRGGIFCHERKDLVDGRWENLL